MFVAVTVLLAVVIILITGALVVGVFLNYRRTGSLIPSMPKLPRYNTNTPFNYQQKSSNVFEYLVDV